MAYVQFSIYNIPAIVTHGDSLSLKAYSKWITPMYFINDFPGKQKRKEMINTLRKLLIDTDQSSKNNSHLQIEESAIAATPDIDMQSIREKFKLQSLFNELYNKNLYTKSVYRFLLYMLCNVNNSHFMFMCIFIQISLGFFYGISPRQNSNAFTGTAVIYSLPFFIS